MDESIRVLLFMYVYMYIYVQGYSQASVMNRLGSLFFIVINQVTFFSTYVHTYIHIHNVNTMVSSSLNTFYIYFNYVHTYIHINLVGVQQCHRCSEFFPE